MKNSTKFSHTLFLFIFCLQILNAQHFEKNWQSFKTVSVTQVEPSKIDDGWLAVVSGKSIAEVHKYDAFGNLLWNYEASFSDFPNVIGYSSVLTPLQNGNYLFTVSGFECDIYMPTGFVLLDEMGQVLGIDTIGGFGFNFMPAPFGFDGIGPIVSVSDSICWVFGDNNLWEYNLNGFKRNQIPYEDIGIAQRPIDAWRGNNGLVYLAEDQMYVFDRNKSKVDSFALERDFDFGVALTDSSHLIVRGPTVEIIDDVGNVLHDWIIKIGEYYSKVEILDDKIVFLGGRFDDDIATFNRFDMDLTNHEQFEWGTDFLQTNDLAIRDSFVVIGGLENMNARNLSGNYTPYLKTFNLSDFSTSDFQKEAALEDFSVDAAVGEVKSRVINSSGSIWNTAVWEFQNLNVLVKNNGTETLKEVTVNWQRFKIQCGRRVISKTVRINLAPGLSTRIPLGTQIDSVSGWRSIPQNVRLCVWLSAPDKLLDADNTNDYACKDFPVKDVTSTDNIFTSNDLEVYPNPSSGFLNIDFKNVELTNSKIQIIDPLGRIVFSDENEKGVHSKKLNISGLSNGIYFLILENEKGQVVRKWVKE